jgi:hypothetical protein
MTPPDPDAAAHEADCLEYAAKLLLARAAQLRKQIALADLATGDAILRSSDGLHQATWAPVAPEAPPEMGATCALGGG